MRFIAGQDLNLIERARSITPSPAADSLFPVTRLYDGYADAVFRFGSNAADPKITADLAMLDSAGADNGNLDTWAASLPTSWVVTATGGGTVTQETPGRGGSGSAARLTKGAGVASVKKTYRVRAGERLTIEVYLARNLSGIASAQVYDPGTRKYLHSSGAWQAAQTYFAAESASGAYVQKTLAFQVEGFVAHQGGIAYLEISVFDTGAGGGTDYALVDDLFLWPTWNAVVVVGHNIDPGMVTELRSDTAAFAGAGTLEATLTPTRPAFVGYLGTPAAKRYARLALAGAQSSQGGAIYVGELVVCYLETALVGPADGMRVRYVPDQTRHSTRSGHVTVTRHADERRVVQMTFERVDPLYTTEVREARDEIMRRTQFGVHPIVVAPFNDIADIVIHGRVSSNYELVLLFPTLWEDDILVEESALPTVVS